MAQVVLSLDEVHDKKLRGLANSIYKGQKGSLSRVVREGIDLVEEKVKRERALKRLTELSENARDLGIGSFAREEAYER